MPVNLRLNEMSLADKLELLEALWDSLSKAPDQLESPCWHKDILVDRSQRIESGEESFSDFEAAKEEIRRRTIAED